MYAILFDFKVVVNCKSIIFGVLTILYHKAYNVLKQRVLPNIRLAQHNSVKNNR